MWRGPSCLDGVRLVVLLALRTQQRSPHLSAQEGCPGRCCEVLMGRSADDCALGREVGLPVVLGMCCLLVLFLQPPACAPVELCTESALGQCNSCAYKAHRAAPVHAWVFSCFVGCRHVRRCIGWCCNIVPCAGCCLTQIGTCVVVVGLRACCALPIQGGWVYAPGGGRISTLSCSPGEKAVFFL